MVDFLKITDVQWNFTMGRLSLMTEVITQKIFGGTWTICCKNKLLFYDEIITSGSFTKLMEQLTCSRSEIQHAVLRPPQDVAKW